MVLRPLLPLVVLLLAAGWSQAFEWELKRIDGRDYVNLKQIEEFYNLPSNVMPENNRLLLARGRRSLAMTKDRRDLEINGVNQWLSFPVIERDGQYWISRMDLGKTIEPAFQPELVQGIKPFSTVVLDPGHGGHDKGAASIYELEKNFSLDIARGVRNELQKAGIQVIMTRNSDVFIELQNRAAIANAKPNAIFVSLHFNAGAGNNAATGLEIYCVTPRGSPSTEYEDLRVRDMVQESGNANELASFTLANAIYHSMQGSLNMFDRGVKRARFAVLRLTKVPAVLVEGGFLTNPTDAKLIASKPWREQYAKSIATGILEYKKLAESKTPPRLVADYRNPSAGPVRALPQPTPTATPAAGTLMLRDLPAEKANY